MLIDSRIIHDTSQREITQLFTTWQAEDENRAIPVHWNATTIKRRHY